MPARNLYNIIVPRDAQTQVDSSQSANIATQAVLEGDLSSVDALSLDPNERRLEATIRGTYAGKIADELESLFAASGFDKVAYYSRTGTNEAVDGYYVLEDGSFESASLHDDRVQRVEGTLRRTGTRSSHYRELAVSPSKTDYPGANNETCEVGIPAAAGDVYWVNKVTGDATPAAPTTSREGQVASVDVFDASPGSTPYDDVVLAYDAPYDADHPVNCLVWDTRGNGSRTDSDGVVQWQRCYRTDHDPEGSLVLDNGLLRVTLDTTGGLDVEEYDPSQSAWTTLSLPTSDWSLQDVDVRDIRPTRVATRLVFANASSGDTYPLRGLLHRGRTHLQFDRVDSSTTAVPSGLVDYLTPLAGSSLYDSGASLGLRDHGEVNA